MAAITTNNSIFGSIRSQIQDKEIWIKSPKWDLGFLIVSGVISLVPYTIFLLTGGSLTEAATQQGTAAYTSRLVINNLVLLLIGGPHMYATFTRTLLDPTTFQRKKWLYITTALAIPMIVFTMAVASYDSYVWLLSIFFTMASLHAMQQIFWVMGAYDIKNGYKPKLWENLIDYAFIFSSLYVLPTWLVVRGSLVVGPVSLKFNELFNGFDLLAIGITALLIFSTIGFVAKSIRDYFYGRLHWGKTLLILATVFVMGSMPIFPNLDTAFQGINTWHSFQYLALTWLALQVMEAKTGRKFAFMHYWRNLYDSAKEKSNSIVSFFKNLLADFGRSLSKLDNESGFSSFYLVTIAMLPLSGLIVMISSSLLPGVHEGLAGADEVYTYMGILSVLLVHYVHDGFLFQDHDDLVLEYKPQ